MLVITMQYVQFIQGTTLWFVHLENLANLFSFLRVVLTFCHLLSSVNLFRPIIIIFLKLWFWRYPTLKACFYVAKRYFNTIESTVEVFVPSGDASLYTTLLNAWCPEYGQVKVYLTDTGEEAILLQEWLRLRMIRSQVSRVVDAGKHCQSWQGALVTWYSKKPWTFVMSLSDPHVTTPDNIN